MKILYVTGVLNRGGAELMLLDIVKKIDKSFEVNILVNYKDESKGVLDKEFENLGCKIYYIKTQWTLGPYKYFFKFRKIIDEIGDLDIIHIKINIKSGIVCLFSKFLKIPKIIVHSHGEIKYKNSSIKMTILNLEFFFQKYLINKYATDFWACSFKAGKTLFPKKNKEEIIVIKNAIDFSVFEKIELTEINLLKSKYANGEKIILGTVGRIVPRKNLLFIIEILNRLKIENYNFIFVNIGKEDDRSYFEKVLKKVKEYDLEDSFIHLGLREDIPQLISIFDVFLSPANNEAFGIVAIESQAAGVKTILSRGFPIEVDLGLNLVDFIEESDVGSWVEKIKMGKDIKLSKEIIKQAFENNGYEINKNIKIIERLYETK